jgi:hypothetical protein
VVQIECPGPDASVEATGGGAGERKPTNCRISEAGGKAVKGEISFRRGEVRIASIWSWNNRLRCGRKPKTRKPERDDKYWSCFFELDQWVHGNISFLFPAVDSVIAGLEEAEEASAESSPPDSYLFDDGRVLKKSRRSVNRIRRLARIADSSSKNAVSFSSERTTKHFPLPRCASEIVRLRRARVLWLARINQDGCSGSLAPQL